MDQEMRYSELLHRSAEKWGLSVLPGRPLVGLPPISTREGVKGDPYQPDIEIVETIEWHGHTEAKTAKIELFQFNGKWGFCLDVATSKQGFGYGPFLKFCDPYDTRREAVNAAAQEILTRTEDPKLKQWAKGFFQLQLF